MTIHRKKKRINNGGNKTVTTNGGYVIDKLGKILVCHPTNHPLTLWSIPKGMYEEGETSKEAVIRETLEETNIDLNLYYNITVYKDLGAELYTHKRKKLHGHLFLIDLPMSELNLDLTCTSMFECPKTGMELPENDITKWETLEFAQQLLHYSQQKFLKKIIDLLVSKELK